MAGGSAMISVFIREPEFVGQTKDRLATQEAARLVENAVRDRFDHWLAADTRTAGAILDYLVLEGRGAGAAAGGEGDQPQDRGQEAAAAGQARRLLGGDAARARSSSSSRATRPAARPSRRATARPRRCCRSGARS